MDPPRRMVRPPFQGIHFLRATSKDGKSLFSEPDVLSGECTGSITAGQEARDFYESVISMESSTGSTCTSSTCTSKQTKPPRVRKRTQRSVQPPESRKPQRQSERTRMRNINNFMRSAQEGDVKSMKLYLKEETCDINVVDSFNWTAFMCASYSGQFDAVKFLLGRGALWEHQRDKSGQNALDLAKRAGRVDIVRMLEDRHMFVIQPERRSPNPDTMLWCEVCRVQFCESSKCEHQSCTVHLFNCQHKPQSTIYYIPESNVGFQMMMRDGWDKEQGLGPDGAGLKFPVKTVLKRDRKGLGAADKEDDTAKARVTHFKPFDVKAVKRPVQPQEKKMRTSTLGKRAREKLGKKERNWERDFRQSFHLEL